MDCVGAELDGGCTGALAVGVAGFCTVCVPGAAAVWADEVACAIGAGADGGAAACVGVATVGADVPGSPARATPASAAKQAMTPATRIDRATLLARVDMLLLFPSCEQISHKTGLGRLKKMEFAGR